MMEPAKSKPHIYKRDGTWYVLAKPGKPSRDLLLAAVRYIDNLNKVIRDKSTPMVFNWIEPLNW